ncbi:MAG: 23S rRNA (uridine(2552)-2'-O)-methyltransferase RlmE [Legionellales bacterium]|nr:23S rRNA (uridine(2552)-2'-O)-methyltransferase RlmE [Legionellales bacterium]
MARSKSSKRWLQEHFADPYVKKAHAAGYRSRAVFKLMEIQKQDHLIKSGMIVVDLGAAPGGWSQLLVDWVKPAGQVIALDILPMDALAGVEVITGDFTSNAVYEVLMEKLQGKQPDVVLSDMSPNMSGLPEVDKPRSMYLVELSFDFAIQVLKPGGVFLTKVFQGEGSEAFLKRMRQSFDKVIIRKPDASRDRSSEVYMIGRGKRRVCCQ